MLSGQLRKRVVLQSRTSSQDAFGQQVLTWSDVIYGDVIGAAVSVTSLTAGTTTTVNAALHGFSDGMLVKLAGITGADNLNATFQISSVLTNSFVVTYNSTGLTLGVSTATATQVSGVPAAILPLYGFEKQSMGQASEVHQVLLRYHTALAAPISVAAMRVCYGTRFLDVTGSINTDERNREMVLTCTEGLTQG